MLADDLTGALDTGACFAHPGAALPVTWGDASPPQPGSFAFDTETREADAATAARCVTVRIGYLAGAQIAFKKLDSLLRGHPAIEIAACMGQGGFRSAVVAPAFPAQGRITRAGKQHVMQGGTWRPIPLDLGAALRQLGVPAQGRPRGAGPAGAGVFLCDAETDDDLAQLAGAVGELEGPVLWCGTAGLARALAAPGAGRAPSDIPRARALLVVIGSDHPVAVAQSAQFPRAAVVPVTGAADVPAAASRLGEHLAERALACLVFRFTDIGRAACQAAMQDTLRQVVAALPRPDAVLATGGDTAFRLCTALGASYLLVDGALRPGVPLSRLQGGDWDGVPLVTKSGAFGDRGFLADLAAEIRGEAL